MIALTICQPYASLIVGWDGWDESRRKAPAEAKPPAKPKSKAPRKEQIRLTATITHEGKTYKEGTVLGAWFNGDGDCYIGGKTADDPDGVFVKPDEFKRQAV